MKKLFLISLFCIFSVQSIWAMRCPPERFLRSMNEGGRVSVNRENGERIVTASIRSTLYDLYRSCRIKYRTESDGHGNLVRRPYRDMYERKERIEDNVTRVNIISDDRALLVPGETESFTVTFNYFENSEPKVILPEYYNSYFIQEVYSSGHNVFDVVVGFNNRNKVTPPNSIKNIREKLVGNQLYVRAEDVARQFLNHQDNSNSRIAFKLSIKRRWGWGIRHSKEVKIWTREYNVRDIPSTLEFGPIDIDSPKRSHEFQVSITRFNSNFYNQNVSPISEDQFYPRKKTATW